MNLSPGKKVDDNINPKVLFVPDWRGGNPYLDLLAEGIRSAGLTVGFANYPETELPLLALAREHPTVRVIHLHWINPRIKRIFWSGNSIKVYLRCALLMLDVILVRLRGIKVVWTVHNLLSHESVSPQREIMARRALARVVTRLVFHSDEARNAVEQLLSMRLENRSAIIRHGNYLGMYPDDHGREQQLREQFGLQEGDTVMLLFGGLRRYKGINQLLAAFRDNDDPSLRLIIAGRPFEQDLAEDIQKAAADDPRISAYLGFIPDADVSPLYTISHLVITPFERTLSSGSVILALSQGKALLLPEDARVLGLPDTRGVLFFNNNDGLRSALNALPARDKLQAMGQINFELAKTLDWSSIGRQTVAAYGANVHSARG